MFVLGHLGVGSKIVSPWTRDLPKSAVFFGCLLPDLMDKALYYGLVEATGRRSFQLGLICGTRTFGHTALFCLALALAARALRSPALKAVTLGVASHLLLDNLGEITALAGEKNPYLFHALLWPALRPFPPYIFKSASEHFKTFLKPYIFAGEVAGAYLLLMDFLKSRRVFPVAPGAEAE